MAAAPAITHALGNRIAETPKDFGTDIQNRTLTLVIVANNSMPVAGWRPASSPNTLRSLGGSAVALGMMVGD